ncbi:Undecaprenyl phosphate-alpha-4-amino-4-deoxy-L-arabinose arabinosyl transferase [Sporomusa carbonis]|uniref:ArnT family glycosyltransferase n=1 Tax=Sporomusa carbonis TaxID=3076075 RepID=UPI003A71BBF3
MQGIRLTLIFLVALMCYVTFNGSIAVTDPVESNYALTAKEMLESGDWLSPRIYGQYWFDKPVMIYWLIALSYKLFGINEFAARFPAGVFSAASVTLLYWFAGKVYNRQTAWLAALVLATSLEFWVLARMIITDAVLLFFNSAAMALFFLGLSEGGTVWYWAAYAAAGMAVLTKGPVGIVLPGLTVFVYIVLTRQWRLFCRLRIFSGLAVFLLVAGPWYALMYFAHGRDFIDTFLGLHNYLRATVSEHPKDNVFYYYLVLFPVSLLPWTGLLFKFLKDIRQELSSPLAAYLVVWPGVMLLFYTLMATKYPTYVFPASFPAALLMGKLLYQMRQREKRSEWLWLSVPALLVVVGMLAGRSYIADSRILLYILAAVTIGALLWLQFIGKFSRLPEMTALAVVVLSLVLVSTALAPLAATRSAKALAGVLPPSGYAIGAYGEYAASMVFYSGHIMPLLVTGQEEAGKQSVWSGKYTMPKETFADYVARSELEPQAFILTKGRDEQSFRSQSWASDYTPVAVQHDMILYQRQAYR